MGMYVKQRGGGSGQSFDFARGDSVMTYFRCGSAASVLSFVDFDGAAGGHLCDADLVHFIGIIVVFFEFVANLMCMLLKQFVMVSFDLNY